MYSRYHKLSDGSRPPKNYGGTAAASHNGAGRGPMSGADRSLAAGPDVQNFAFPQYAVPRRMGQYSPHKKTEEGEQPATVSATIPDDTLLTAERSSSEPTEQKSSGRMHDLGTLLAEMKLSSTDLLLIVLTVYFLNSHADDGMAVLLLILLGLGMKEDEAAGDAAQETT